MGTVNGVGVSIIQSELSGYFSLPLLLQPNNGGVAINQSTYNNSYDLDMSSGTKIIAVNQINTDNIATLAGSSTTVGSNGLQFTNSTTGYTPSSLNLYETGTGSLTLSGIWAANQTSSYIC